FRSTTHHWSRLGLSPRGGRYILSSNLRPVRYTGAKTACPDDMFDATNFQIWGDECVARAHIRVRGMVSREGRYYSVNCGSGIVRSDTPRNSGLGGAQWTTHLKSSKSNGRNNPPLACHNCGRTRLVAWACGPCSCC